MRLENKMHKWLKFILKLLPFLYIFYNIFALLGSDLGPFFALNLGDNPGDNGENWCNALYWVVQDTLTNVYEFLLIPDLFFDFNDFIFNLMPSNSANGTELFFIVLYSFEWFLLVDFIDLIFSAFRFIIDICRSWLDGFYTRSKRGGK